MARAHETSVGGMREKSLSRLVEGKGKSPLISDEREIQRRVSKKKKKKKKSLKREK